LRLGLVQIQRTVEVEEADMIATGDIKGRDIKGRSIKGRSIKGRSIKGRSIKPDDQCY